MKFVNVDVSPVARAKLHKQIQLNFDVADELVTHMLYPAELFALGSQAILMEYIYYCCYARNAVGNIHAIRNMTFV